MDPTGSEAIETRIRRWATELGFDACGITDVVLDEASRHLEDWLQRGWHGEMSYMSRHGERRHRPEILVPGTRRVISVRMDYLPDGDEPVPQLEDPAAAFVSRYALGRDYHKLMRRRLQQLADRITEDVGAFGYRAFVDSAPVMEKPLAQKAGLGWIGKHTNLLHQDAGSWFFLGELYTDLPLEVDAPASDHCGSCARCIEVCPTDAIVAPYQLDARRCISYLTIELQGPIPHQFRRAMGNRIYGCDDCQLFCPWNKFAQPTREDGFSARHGLDRATLIELWGWDESDWYRRMEGSAIRRIGYEKWLSNLAIALGNAGGDAARRALERRRDHPSDLVAEAIAWALAEINPGDEI